uniref:Lipoyltransferase 1, mitochondrial n=2 Tax=Melanaphis sacchari TaxID=742174 RepID=A0A2H8TEX0_9HEMI
MTAVGLQYLKTVGNKTTTDQGFNYVTPNEQTFPGFNEIKNEMESWEWRYGRTPKFNITVKSNDEHSVILSVKNGIIENVATTCNVSLSHLINEKFNMKIVEEIKQCLETIRV